MRHPDWLLHQLPVGMAEDDFLVRYLKIMQNISDTVLHQIDSLEHSFDPAVAPDSMVRLMAEWFAVDWVDSSLPDSLQRAIVMRYSEIMHWRGTKRGLRGLLEVLTGGPAVVVDSGGVFAEGEAPEGPEIVYIDVQHVGWNRFEDLIRIIESELPASVVFQLTIDGKRVWPRGVGLPTYDSMRYAPMAKEPVRDVFTRVVAGQGGVDLLEVDSGDETPGHEGHTNA